MTAGRLAGALLASVLLHALVLGGAALELPGDDAAPNLVRMDARMVRSPADLPVAQAAALPPPVKAAAPVTPPPVAKTSLPAPPEPPPAEPPVEPPVEPPPPELPQATGDERIAADPPPAADAPPPTPEVPAAAPAATPDDPPPPAGQRWPVRGRITYTVTRGDPGFEIGRSQHQWDIQPGGRYHLMAVTETTGVVAMLRPVKVTQASIGRLTPGGFQPDSFMMRRDGHQAPARAQFDWAGGRIRQNDGDSPLPPGTQDQLSLFYQVGYPGYPRQVLEVPIATGRKLVDYRFEIVGEESLALPFGQTWRTLRVRARHEEVTEIWVALDHFSLPVKIRHIDRKGDVYDQIATEILVSKDALEPKTP